MTARELILQLEEEYPVILNLSVKERQLRIHSIVVKNTRRNEGIGTQVMQRICQFADDNDLVATLTPAGDFGGSVRRLNKFYSRFGFVKNKNFRYTDSMIRFATK